MLPLFSRGLCRGACLASPLASSSRRPLTSLPLRRLPVRPSLHFPQRYLSTPSSSPPSAASTSSSPSPTLAPAPGVTQEVLAPKPTAPTSLIDRVVPAWAAGAKPYLHLIRIDKPIGWILLYWPCTWGITMAASVNHLPPSVPLWYMGLFGVGAIIMRGAGCIINDMWDQKYDKAVERTQWRPLAAGDVTQLQALTFLGANLSLGLAVLTQLNMYSIILGASSLALVVIYPFMKRITYYPQITFGLTFNWGILLGWSAVAGYTDWVITLPMYFGGVAWGVMYDCIYAHQDKKDDVIAGVKSIALRFPDTSRPLISTLSAGFVSTLAITGHLAGLGPLYYLISCAGAASHLAWQCLTVDFDNRADCWKKFCSNGWLGGLIWVGIAADYVQRIVLPGLY